MKKTLLSTIGALMFTSTAFAGGFQLSEYTTTGIGRAFAGAGVVGDDYSAIAFNPAGMALNHSGIQGGVSMVNLYSNVHGEVVDSVDAHGDKEGKIRKPNFVPHIFGQYEVNPCWRIGAGIYTPYGFSLDYNDSFYGLSHANKTEIAAVNYALAVSYSIVPELTIGAGVIAQTLEAKLTNSVTTAVPPSANNHSDMHARSFDVTGNVGILYQPTKTTRFGLSYNGKGDHKLKGHHQLAYPGYFGYGDVDAHLVLPEYLLLSAYHQTGKWGLSASAKRSRWSRFKTLDIYSTAVHSSGARLPVGAVNENWKDTWTLSAGTDYYYSDDLTYRFGIAYDETGVKSAKYRTARLPDADRWILGVGGSYQLTPKVVLDLAYAHMFMKTAKSCNTNPRGDSTFYARYRSQINIVSATLQYNF